MPSTTQTSSPPLPAPRIASSSSAPPLPGTPACVASTPPPEHRMRLPRSSPCSSASASLSSQSTSSLTAVQGLCEWSMPNLISTRHAHGEEKNSGSLEGSRSLSKSSVQRAGKIGLIRGLCNACMAVDKFSSMDSIDGVRIGRDGPSVRYAGGHLRWRGSGPFRS